MKLALLGCDDEALELLRGALGGEHALVAAYDPGAFRDQIGELAAGAHVSDNWEALLLGTVADVVVVARGRLDPSRDTGFAADERRCDQLRKLVQAAVPLVIIHPGCEAIVGFELEMIRSDSKGIIVPFIPGRNQAAARDLASFTLYESSSPIGAVEQIVFEREMTNRSRPQVLAQLARDMSLVREFLGAIRKMSASGPAAGETADPLGPKPNTLPPLENLSVHLSGEESFPARWTVAPAEHQDQLRITVIGSRGRAALTLAGGLGAPAAALKISVAGETQASVLEFPSQDEFENTLSAVSRALGCQTTPTTSWLDACRDVEVASSVDRSLQRGRAVEFFGEEHSEEQSFKGVMAVGGCLLLSVVLVGLMIAATVEGLQLPLRESRFWKAWPIYLLVPIALFLLLQLLQVVARRPEKKQKQGTTT